MHPFDKQAAQERGPNILLLFPDQWRWDWLGCEQSPYGPVPVQTPNIDALAARGVRFTQCRSNSPLCVPARAALAQGVRYHRCGALDNSGPVYPDRDTFLKRLRGAGYRVLSCGKSDLHGHSVGYHNSGWHPVMGRLGFTDAIDQRGKLNSARPPLDKPGPYVDYLRRRGVMQVHADDYRRRHEYGGQQLAPFPTPLAREDFTDDFCGRCALELLDRKPADAPWMLWVNFPGPHDPHDAPRELQQLYDGESFPPPVNGQEAHNGKPIDHQQLRRNYAASCTGLDQWIGRILERVAQRGELDNTLVILASDHGEMLGDHGRWHKAVWQDPSARVPLVVAGPGVEPGRVDGRPVELIDVAATILEAAGLEVPAHMDARSVFGQPRDVTVSGLGGADVQSLSPSGWHMITDGRHKLVRLGAERTLLYDLHRDPTETAPVENPNTPQARALNQKLDAALADTDRPVPAGGVQGA